MLFSTALSQMSCCLGSLCFWVPSVAFLWGLGLGVAAWVLNPHTSEKPQIPSNRGHAKPRSEPSQPLGVQSTQISRAPKDHPNIRILPTMVSGIPLVLVLGSGMCDPYVYVANARPLHRVIVIMNLGRYLCIWVLPLGSCDQPSVCVRELATRLVAAPGTQWTQVCEVGKMGAGSNSGSEATLLLLSQH